MLEGLDAIDWKRLTHADGHAGGLPDFVRALASDDPETRERGWDGLFGTIWHQGTVYEATPLAIPFLVELVAHPDVAGKDEILNLLSFIAGRRSYLDVHIRSGLPRPGEDREREWVRAARAAVEDGVATYLDLLDHEDPEVRRFAALTLGHCPGRAGRIIPGLVARVAVEEDPRCRAALILAAGTLAAADGAPGPAGPLFAERMRPGEHPLVRRSAATAAARSSPVGPSAEVLSGLLDSRDEAVRRGARDAAERLAQERRSVTPRVVAALGQRIAGADVADRRGLVEVLAGLGLAAAAAAGPLAVALDDDDPHVRTYAALALAGLRDPRAIPVLIERLADPRTFLRATNALGRFGAGARAAVPALLEVIRQPHGETSEARRSPIPAAEALGRIGPDARSAIPDLIDLAGKQPHAQGAAARAIGRIGGPGARAAIPLLEEMLRSPEDWDRIFAARALWRIEGRADRLVPILAGCLAGHGVRSTAAEVLGEMGEAARVAIPALVACLEDTSFEARLVHLEAAVALWRIERRADRVLPVLIGLLRDPGTFAAPAATGAAEALGELGALAREAVPILRELEAADVRPFGGAVEEIVTQDEAFRAAVAEALRRIEGDRD